jgi:hypothetical protein
MPAGGRMMTRNVASFGDHLQQFARTVDIVDERTIEEVRRLVYRYVEKELAVTYFALAIDTVVDGKPALRTLWSTGDETHTTTIRTPEGRYSSQISVAFDQRDPLWVVDKERRPLRSCDEYLDLWSGVKDLPKYQAPKVNRDMRTSIVVPLVHWGNVFGVMYLESTSYLDVTDVAKDELSLFSDALAILFDLQRANRAQTQGTTDAIFELQRIQRESTFPHLTKPQIFIASSSRADDAVRGVMQGVLDEFSTILTVVQWDRIEASGSISMQLIEQVATSRFGLCYFSEPAPDGRNGYVDNPNVLFEAGMLHSLTNSPVGQPSGWVPVREKASPRIPFDFATERVLEVPRYANGEINEQKFKDDLRRRIKALLSDASST